MKDKLRIAIQKSGRLSEQSTSLLKSIGLDFNRYDRQLFASCTNLPVNILFTRDDNIPEFVETGAADIGIVGLDCVLESNSEVEVIQDLDFGYCELCVAAPITKRIKSITDLSNKTIATSFPVITRDYFEGINVPIKIVEIKGGVELAPYLEIADAIVDLVSSGTTLKMNNLEVVEVVQKIRSVLISKRDLSVEKQDFVDQLVFRINSLQKAKQYKYIMMNLPKDKLAEVQGLTPGLKSPTVAELETPGWISVQTVILESKFWEVVNRLKDLGAEGIIVLPIEKLIS